MMDPEEIQAAAESICEMRNPTHIKADQSDFRYGDRRFKDRVEKTDRRLADIADEKELKEVYAL